MRIFNGNKLTAIREVIGRRGLNKKETEIYNNNDNTDRRPIVFDEGNKKGTKKKSEIDYIALAYDPRSSRSRGR